MKNLLLMMVLILTLSCSKEDEASKQSIKISPPTWIIGEWYQEGDAAKSGVFKFTSDDFCNGALNTYSCNKEALTIYVNGKMTANVKEDKSDTQYSIEMTFSNQEVTYVFQKVSATKIRWVNNPYGGAIDAVFIKK